jgi:hypothetical protein
MGSAKSTARNHPAKGAGWGGGGCATSPAELKKLALIRRAGLKTSARFKKEENEAASASQRV